MKTIIYGIEKGNLLIFNTQLINVSFGDEIDFITKIRLQ